MRKTTALLSLIVLAGCLPACRGLMGTPGGSKGIEMTKMVGDREYSVQLLFEDDFEDLDNWVAESKGTQEAAGNELVWDCNGGSIVGTIWCRQRFEGPTIVEYDVVSVAGADNINFLFYAQKEEGLLETTGERTGDYKGYHAFQNYIITYLTQEQEGGRKNWRIRFRKDPGFELISETFVERPTAQPLRQHITYVFEADGTMSLYADGDLLHTYSDEDMPCRAGYHGFRTWNSLLKYSNFRVYGIREP